MARDNADALQDMFLERVAQQRTSLTIFLANGVRLQGWVAAFDKFCVLLQRDGQIQLVYKHAISTIMPTERVDLYQATEDGSEAPQEPSRPVIVETKSRPRTRAS